MADDIPTPAKGVYIYFHYVALGFVLVAIEELVRNTKAWKVWLSCLVLGAVFLFIGVMGPRIKRGVVALIGRFRNFTALKAAQAEIVELRGQIEELKQNQRPTAWAILSKRYPMSSGPPTSQGGREATLGEMKANQEWLVEQAEREDPDAHKIQGQLEDERRISAANREQIGQYMRRIQELERENTNLKEGDSLKAQAKLSIISAKYGPEDQSFFDDVTLAVLARLNNNKIDMEVSDREFPERIAGRRLSFRLGTMLRNALIVRYSYGSDVEATVVRYEGDRLVLP